jgi:hypothetical protein
VRITLAKTLGGFITAASVQGDHRVAGRKIIPLADDEAVPQAS